MGKQYFSDILVFSNAANIKRLSCKVFQVSLNLFSYEDLLLIDGIMAAHDSMERGKIKSERSLEAKMGLCHT